MTSARSELIDAVAKRLGVPPLTKEEVDSVLELAGAAAHGTGDRTAAPLCCFLAGTAAGDDRMEALERVHNNVKEATS